MRCKGVVFLLVTLIPGVLLAQEILEEQIATVQSIADISELEIIDSEDFVSMCTMGSPCAPATRL